MSSRNVGDERCVTALKIVARETRPAWHEQTFNREGPREGSNRSCENAMVPRAPKSFVPVTRQAAGSNVRDRVQESVKHDFRFW